MTGVIGVLTIELFKLMRALGAYIYLLPVVLLLLGLWWWLVRYSIRDGFGVDKITVQNGDLHWKSKALWLKQEVNIPVNAISAVRAVTPCHGLQNRVELTVKKGTYKMGEGILRGEAEQLAHVLKQTLEIN
jgi:hypothetical protein